MTVAAQWQRCDTCRKIRSAADFAQDATVCVECRTKPARSTPAVRVTRAAAGGAARPAVSSAAAPAPGPEGPLVSLGARGRGDREVRVRRARLRALEELAKSHPEEFATLLAKERAAEGL